MRLWAAVRHLAEPGATLCLQWDGKGPRRSNELGRASERA